MAITLKMVGDNKIQVIKLFREVTGKELGEAKSLIDSVSATNTITFDVFGDEEIVLANFISLGVLAEVTDSKSVPKKVLIESETGVSVKKNKSFKSSNAFMLSQKDVSNMSREETLNLLVEVGKVHENLERLTREEKNLDDLIEDNINQAEKIRNAFPGSISALSFLVGLGVCVILTCIIGFLVGIIGLMISFGFVSKKMKAKQVVYIPGVGISVERFANATADKIEKRQELGVPADAFLLMSVGELNTNKNHAAIIKAIHQLNNPDVYYAIIGNGNQDTLKSMIDSLGLSGRVMLLGYRTDIPDLYRAADVFAFPSKREGLGLAAVEAMAAGLPLITSNINGINDYSIDGITGYSRHSDDVDGFADCIRRCMSDREWLERTGKSNIERSRKYDRSNVNEIMIRLYQAE